MTPSLALPDPPSLDLARAYASKRLMRQDPTKEQVESALKEAVDRRDLRLADAIKYYISRGEAPPFVKGDLYPLYTSLPTFDRFGADVTQYMHFVYWSARLFFGPTACLLFGPTTRLFFGSPARRPLQ